ncbi:DUF3042 family protein [Lactococcus termiticola]|uniref:DUF3042 domain-containing protein n=1 Tax=Lactococcus termiticola TaxID=2169526 RepID=A0A2R5HJV0_9LACT|nr:DUF3042 family protein [Lactococcus termiticola]GBG96960.1 hypothetical protein NtB2_01096 [Lactococcus termiticola]
MSKSFIGGFVAGGLAVIIVIATAGGLYKAKVIDPVEEKWNFIEENRKKAKRKRIAH